MKIKNKDKICERCNTIGVHAKGLCQKCYNKYYNIINKDKKNEYMIQWRNDNQDHIVEYNKQYCKDHVDQIKEYNATHRESINKRLRECRKYRPVFAFLGKQFPLLRHDRPPEGYLYHHLVYDHADPEANIVLMERGAHSVLHRIFELSGVKIPHINRPNL